MANLEVYFQDVFFTNGKTLAEETHSPIDENTWSSWFSRWLDSLNSDLPPAESYELTLRLSDDAEIQNLNRQYRYKDQPTDVLAFAALEVEPPQGLAEYPDEPLYLGDIIISVDTAAQQAQQQGHSLTLELAWLAAHGFLHLLGWDHPDDETLKEMLSKQETLLQSVGLISLDNSELIFLLGA